MKSICSRLAPYAILCIVGIAVTNAQDDALAKFGDTIAVLGKMERTDQDFEDGLALDLFSPSNRTLVVTNNTSPLPGNFVTGSSGEGFINLSTYSWVIKFNETANDLIAKIELPYDPVAVKEQGVDIANTYVGTLAQDGKSWVVSEAQRNVHVSENKTRIIKMTSLEGEFMLLGRKTVDTSNIFVQYGQGATRTVNVTGGAGIEEAEFIDGLRFSIQSSQAFTMNVDIPFGVDQAALPSGTVALNSFAWVLNTTAPSGNSITTDIRVPINQAILAAKAPGKSHEHVTVARRKLNAAQTDAFEVVKDQKVDKSGCQIKLTGLSDIDGQYVLVVAGEEK